MRKGLVLLFILLIIGFSIIGLIQENQQSENQVETSVIDHDVTT